MLLATALLPCLFIQHLGHEDDDGLGRGELNTGAPRSEAGKSELCWLGEAPLPLASTSRGCPPTSGPSPCARVCRRPRMLEALHEPETLPRVVFMVRHAYMGANDPSARVWHRLRRCSFHLLLLKRRIA
jgi:hypothetical protein